MALSMVILAVNFPGRIAILMLIFWSLIAPHCAHGAPTQTPTLRRIKSLKTKIACTGYTALLSGSPSTSPFVLTVSTRQETVVSRNLTAHPVTLENLFLNVKVNQNNDHLRWFRTISGQYLSVDGKGHLKISKRRREATFLRPENDTPWLCALGEEGTKHSFLVSPFSTTEPVKLERSDCETIENFNKASEVKGNLKAALGKDEYRFSLVSVTHPISISAEYLVSEELRSLCCSFDRNCDINWFRS